MDTSALGLVVIDPQNDFLRPDGAAWNLVGDSVTANDTVANIGRLLAAAKSGGTPVFVSPHYHFPTDERWIFEGAAEWMLHHIHTVDRPGALDLEGFEGSGADWLEDYKPHIDDGETLITNPHRLYGPDSTDLSLQLRRRGVSNVLLAGMSANLCVEAHLRGLLEEGFEVVVVQDATAGASHPQFGDGYKAALVNFAFLANGVVATSTALQLLEHRAWAEVTVGKKTPFGFPL